MAWAVEASGELFERAQRSIAGGLNSAVRIPDIPFLAYGPGAAFHVIFGEGSMPRNYREFTRRNNPALWDQFRGELIRRGVRAKERGVFYTSCAHTEADVDEVLNRAADAFAAL